MTTATTADVDDDDPAGFGVAAQAEDIAQRIVRALERPLAEAIREHGLLLDERRRSGVMRNPRLLLEGLIRDEEHEEQEEHEEVGRRILLGSVDLSSITIPPTSLSEGNGSPRSPSSIYEYSNLSSPSYLRKRGQVQQASPSDSEESPSKRRKEVGGLRLAASGNGDDETNDTSRQLQCDRRAFPQRKKPALEHFVMQPSSLDKLVIGLWEQIHGSIKIDPQVVVEQWHERRLLDDTRSTSGDASSILAPRQPDQLAFNRMNLLCRKVTQASKCFRSLEVIVQAHWADCFDERVRELAEAAPAVNLGKNRKAALLEACEDFGWPEKELRNKLAIWRGYQQIRHVAGWSALVFAGMGLYRFCKYRVGFDDAALSRLRNLKPRLEVAADTLHPSWRQLLSIIGEPTQPIYTGHPHDWVVSLDGAVPVPLKSTYTQWDQDFSFEHLQESVLDESVWGQWDPRNLVPASSSSSFPSSDVGATNGAFNRSGSRSAITTADDPTTLYLCSKCSEPQSNDPKRNACHCFPTLYPPPPPGTAPPPAPVQVFRTPNNRNNGLLACVPIPRGAAIGEFTGLITANLAQLDVMHCSTTATPPHTTLSSSSSSSLSSSTSDPNNPATTNPAIAASAAPTQPATNQTPTTYQIYQGRRGNYTRFVNHSCAPNSQFERFVWRGGQRVVLVACGRGVAMGDEVTVDYGPRYWRDLDKACLCGEACCRYKERRRRGVGGGV